jgi:uncharacterized membrane protein
MTCKQPTGRSRSELRTTNERRIRNMTIETALSGLTYSMICTLFSFLIVGISIISSTAMIYIFIKALVYLLKATKGGVDNLKESVKALSQTVTT